MALQMQQFVGFTPAMFAAFAAKINKDTGITLNGDTGTVTHGSFEFTYNYDKASQTLKLQCLRKPLFINAATIINGLAEEVTEIIAQVNVAPQALDSPVVEPPASTESKSPAPTM